MITCSTSDRLSRVFTKSLDQELSYRARFGRLRVRLRSNPVLQSSFQRWVEPHPNNRPDASARATSTSFFVNIYCNCHRRSHLRNEPVRSSNSPPALTTNVYTGDKHG